ncbi:MAG: hypothetical protein KJ955_02740 [Nanoarchaeota archaeon]|nr:hypothetical protein [Nanoarchaeota archaeon]
MALDDEIEPVCVKGMDEDVALDRFADTVHLLPREKWIHYCCKADKIVPPVSVAGFYIYACLSDGNTGLLPLAAATIFTAIAYIYRKVAQTNRYAVKWLEQEAELQEKVLKGFK